MERRLRSGRGENREQELPGVPTTTRVDSIVGGGGDPLGGARPPPRAQRPVRGARQEGVVGKEVDAVGGASTESESCQECRRKRGSTLSSEAAATRSAALDHPPGRRGRSKHAWLKRARAKGRVPRLGTIRYDTVQYSTVQYVQYSAATSQTKTAADSAK